MSESESSDTEVTTNMSECELSNSEVDEVTNKLKTLKALPCPDECLEIPSNIKPLSNQNYRQCEPASQTALPYSDESLEISNKVKPRFNRNHNVARIPIENKVVEHEYWDPDNETGNPAKEINILLLGESGVGKSTFINSFANYMKHENFEAVQNNNLSVLIPARFHIFDKDFQKHLIEIGANDNNEYLADGAAATQDVKTYVFHVSIENVPYKIRLIDTPGMGDPRGIDQDNKNCDYILNYLGRLEKVHAICLLLKPTNTRLDVFLNYCITQILSRLEKSATENISFLFTNTRGQNYTPGDTYTSLEVLVKKIKEVNNVNLPLSKNNVFCYDNEAFRFLAAIKHNVEFREGILEANIESWKYSYKEVYRLLSYIVNLKPHDPKKTISINHARKMVLQLSQPLAEIVQLIGDNIYELDQHTKQLLIENQSLEELKQKLHMPVIDIIAIELPQPVTVCTSPSCSTIYKVADKNKFHYKQRCHNPCYLNNVPAEIVGDPHLLQCTAMGGGQICRECHCRFNTHMHIYYETQTFDTKVVDENVLKNINTKEDATKEKQRIINNVLNRKEELEKEHKFIIKCSAAFAHFLQQNAITPINDSLKEYVKYLIKREDNLGENANKASLEYLRRLLAEYEQEKKVLEEAMKLAGATNETFDSSPNAIEQKIGGLFTLQHFGAKIKQLYDLHQSGGKIEHIQSEYVVKEKYKLRDWFKSIGSSIWNGIRPKKAYEQNETIRSEEMKIERRRYFSGMPPEYLRMTKQEMEQYALHNPNRYYENPWQNQSYFFGNSNPRKFSNGPPHNHIGFSGLPFPPVSDGRDDLNYSTSSRSYQYDRRQKSDDNYEGYRQPDNLFLEGNTAFRKSNFENGQNCIAEDTLNKKNVGKKNQKAIGNNNASENKNVNKNLNKKNGKKNQKAIEASAEMNDNDCDKNANQADGFKQIAKRGKKNKKKTKSHRKF